MSQFYIIPDLRLLWLSLLSGQKVDEATELARSARRKRWWCFFLSLLIIAVLAIAIAVPIATKG